MQRSSPFDLHHGLLTFKTSDRSHSTSHSNDFNALNLRSESQFCSTEISLRAERFWQKAANDGGNRTCKFVNDLCGLGILLVW